jgi:ABC-2 type transport system ATP-binding protein
MAIIETRALAKTYDEIKAVDEIDLNIEKGEIFGLLGPNGAGKSTTIGMLCTIIRPTSGKASVAGHDIVKEPAKVRKCVGIVFQDPTLDTVLTGRENLELHARLYGVPKDLMNERIEEVLKLVDLKARADHVTRTYSGGMRRRLELARGLLHKPKVLFLDEPTLGLDPQTRARTWEYIRKMKESEGMTVVLTTHYMEEAEMMCDRVGIIDRGKIIALDTPKALQKLMGGYQVEITAKDPPVEVIKKLPYVKTVEVDGEDVHIIMEDAHIHLPDLLSKIPNTQCVETRAPTLNDVFIKLTGRDIRDEGEDDTGGWMAQVHRYTQKGK